LKRKYVKFRCTNIVKGIKTYICPVEYEIKPHQKLNLGLKEIWLFREMLFFFTWRDIKVKYKQTVLGFLWAILQPLLLMVIFTILGRALNIHENIPHPLFSYSALTLWLVFTTGITNAGNSMITNANIIRKIYFPRLIIPVSSVFTSLFDFVMSFVILICMLVYYICTGAVHVDWLKFILLLPVGIVITAISTFGVGSLMAALTIKYRDFRYVIPFMVQAMLFVTPVIYPISYISFPFAKYILAINPMYSAIELFRSSFNGQVLELRLVAISLFFAMLFFVVGIYYFRKTEAYFADLA
jgi:lipopolysaccharide transport system permease protein